MAGTYTHDFARTFADKRNQGAALVISGYDWGYQPGDREGYKYQAPKTIGPEENKHSHILASFCSVG